MLDICYEELNQLKEDMKDDNFKGVKYLDTWDFEDEYSHNHIEENRKKFIKLANEYFKNNNIPYMMREVCDKNGKILYQKKGI